MAHLLHLPLLALRVGGRALPASIGSVPKCYPDLSTGKDEEEATEPAALEEEGEEDDEQDALSRACENFFQNMQRLLERDVRTSAAQQEFREDLLQLLAGTVGEIPHDYLMGGLNVLLGDASFSGPQFAAAVKMARETLVLWNWLSSVPAQAQHPIAPTETSCKRKDGYPDDTQPDVNAQAAVSEALMQLTEVLQAMLAKLVESKAEIDKLKKDVAELLDSARSAGVSVVDVFCRAGITLDAASDSGNKLAMKQAVNQWYSEHNVG